MDVPDPCQATRRLVRDDAPAELAQSPVKRETTPRSFSSLLLALYLDSGRTSPRAFPRHHPLLKPILGTSEHPTDSVAS